jgi:hypothetical protein
LSESHPGNAGKFMKRSKLLIGDAIIFFSMLMSPGVLLAGGETGIEIARR